MRMAIEMFSMVLVIALSCVMCSSMISMSLQNSEARDYYNLVRNRIEDSNFSKEVIDECIEEACEKGYDLEIKDITVYRENPAKLLKMKYEINIPIYEIMGKVSVKEGVLEGYAR